MYNAKPFTQLRLDGPDAYSEHPFVPPKFTLKPYQHAVARALSVHGPAECIVASHNTGSGKTRTGNTVAEEFIAYHTGMTHHETPLVFVIGYSSGLFIRDLLRHPSSGFVTPEELTKLAHLRQVAGAGTEDDRLALREFESKLKRRLGNPKYGGHFRFYGYKELFNLLFIKRDKLEPGAMVLNMDLLASMANCLVICDETQLLYNHQDTNNHGLALRVIRHLFCEPDAAQAWTGPLDAATTELLRKSSLKWLHLTATPFGTPENVVDLLNIALSPADMKRRAPQTRGRTPPILHREDFYTATGELQPGALNRIVACASGYFSYVFNIDPDHFPRRIFAGTPVRDIDYLAFTLCRMPTALAAAYASEIRTTLPQHAEMLIDGAVRIGGKYYYGMAAIRDVPEAKRRAAGVSILTEGDIEYLGGSFLRTDLPDTFPKLAGLLHQVKENILAGPGKIFISHQRVSDYGILMVREMLRQNGFLDAGAEPNEHTLCNVCCIPYKKHRAARGGDAATRRTSSKDRAGPSTRGAGEDEMDNIAANQNSEDDVDMLERSNRDRDSGTDLKSNIRNEKMRGEDVFGGNAAKDRNEHAFSPVRMLLMYGESDRNGSDRKFNMFNARSNMLGEQYRILCGSKKLNVGYDFEAIRYQHHVSQPNDAAEFLQLAGRSARTGSHDMLPVDQRNVTVYNYINVPPGYDPRRGPGSVYDLARYARMFREYGTVQKISSALYADAIDAYVNAPIIARSLGTSTKLFGAIYFPLQGRRPTPLDSAVATAFYSEAEIRAVLYVIKQLFVLHRVYTREDLWRAVRNPGFRTEFDPHSWSQRNFAAALCRLLNPTPYRSPNETFARLQDPADSAVMYRDNTSYELQGIGKYLMALPPNTTHVDAWNRQVGQVSNRISLQNRLNIEENYGTLRVNFQRTFAQASWYQLMGSLEVYDEEFHKQLVEDCIKYVADLLTGAGKVSEHNDFYYRMLYFYNKLDLVLYADQLLPNITNYSDVSAPPLPGEPSTNRFLMQSITNAETNFDLYRINKYQPPKHKAPANLLPVGHFILGNPYMPRLYHPKTGWSTASEFIDRGLPADVENDIIVGRYDKIPGSIELRFKLSKPTQKQVKHKDLRLNSRGIICTTENKEALRKIMHQLHLTMPPSHSARNICSLIKVELMQRELKSRRDYKHAVRTNPDAKRIRWFYMHFE